MLRLLKDGHSTPKVSISLNDSDALLAALKAACVDAAVLVRPAAVGSRGLLWQELSRQPVVLLAPAGVSDASPAELLRQRGWIRNDTALTRGRTAARHVRRVASRANHTMDLHAIDVIVATVAAGHGGTVMPLPRKPPLDEQRVRVIALGRPARWR